MRCYNLAKNPFIFYEKIDDKYGLFLLVNSLHGNIDIVSKSVIDALSREYYCGDYLYVLRGKGYLIDKYLLYDSLEGLNFKYYLNLLSNRPYMALVPTHDCNSRCIYCFQSLIRTGRLEFKYITKNNVTKAFEAAIKLFERYHPNAKENPRLILFGGEPLINLNVREIVDYILKLAKEYGVEPYDIVTNGVFLPEYADLIIRYEVKSIQVTIDGPQKIHNSRRPSLIETNPFGKIVTGISMLLKSGTDINIYVRTNVDKRNIKYLVDLAKFYMDKGWSNDKRFKPYLSPTQPYGCTHIAQYTLTDSEFLLRILELFRKHEEIKIFSIDSIMLYRHIKDALIKGNFDRALSYCGATNSTYVFDLYGKIYLCMDAIGREQFVIGYYTPNLVVDYNTIKRWHKPVLDKEKCARCSFALICRGNCNFHSILLGHDIDNPPCPNVKRLLKVSVNHFAENIINLVKEKVEVLKLYEHST